MGRNNFEKNHPNFSTFKRIEKKIGNRKHSERQLQNLYFAAEAQCVLMDMDRDTDILCSPQHYRHNLLTALGRLEDPELIADHANNILDHIEKQQILGHKIIYNDYVKVIRQIRFRK